MRGFPLETQLERRRPSASRVQSWPGDMEEAAKGPRLRAGLGPQSLRETPAPQHSHLLGLHSPASCFLCQGGGQRREEGAMRVRGQAGGFLGRLDEVWAWHRRGEKMTQGRKWGHTG